MNIKIKVETGSGEVRALAVAIDSRRSAAFILPKLIHSLYETVDKYIDKRVEPIN